MTHEWKKLGFIVKEKDNLYSVSRYEETNTDIKLSGFVFHIDEEITYKAVSINEQEFKEMIQKTIEYLQDKKDLIHVMGNEWKHFKNHANKVNGK
jgi:MarR-like DNA-binding transcriptional regulator SgrR of sgrS sRNA